MSSVKGAPVDPMSIFQEITNRFRIELEEAEIQMNQVENNLHNIRDTRVASEGNDKQGADPGDLVSIFNHYLDRLTSVRMRISSANEKLCTLV